MAILEFYYIAIGVLDRRRSRFLKLSNVALLRETASLIRLIPVLDSGILLYVPSTLLLSKALLGREPESRNRRLCATSWVVLLPTPRHGREEAVPVRRENK